MKLNELCNYYGISLDYICGLSNIKKHEIINDKIAEIIKDDQSNYSKYELGKILIHTYPLIDFAKHYNVSIDWLCGKVNNNNI